MWSSLPTVSYPRRPVLPEAALRFENQEIYVRSTNGYVDILPWLSDRFARLDRENSFSSEKNIFRTISANQVFCTSDRRKKRNIEKIDGKQALNLLQKTPSYRYTVDGQQTAGLLSEDIPTEWILFV